MGSLAPKIPLRPVGHLPLAGEGNSFVRSLVWNYVIESDRVFLSSRYKIVMADVVSGARTRPTHIGRIVKSMPAPMVNNDGLPFNRNDTGVRSKFCAKDDTHANANAGIMRRQSTCHHRPLTSCRLTRIATVGFLSPSSMVA